LLQAGSCGYNNFFKDLVDGLRSINNLQEEWDISVESVVKGPGGIAAKHVNVISSHFHKQLPPPAPTMVHRQPQHDHQHEHEHSHTHGHTHSHEQGHAQSPDTDSNNKYERNLATISSMIQSSNLPEAVKQRSISAFTSLAIAEAATHGSTIENVHFHEVGAVDSIIDTVGVILGFHLLDVDVVYASAVPFESTGWIHSAHGYIPVPAPATLRLLCDGSIPTAPPPPGAKGELVTPTGACLLCALVSSDRFGGPPNGFTPAAVGIGAGTKEFQQHANIVRIVTGRVKEPVQRIPAPRVTSTGQNIAEPVASSTSSCASVFTAADGLQPDQLIVVECNIDDMTGEIAGYTMQLLLKESLDVWFTPIQMKKSRPAITLSVLCRPEQVDEVYEIIFRETSTLGVRRYAVDRLALQRNKVEVVTAVGVVDVKVGYWGDNVKNVQPEYETCAALARASGVAVVDIIHEATTLATQKLHENPNN